MTKTKIQKIIASLWLIMMIVANTWNTFAATVIWSGSVSWTWAFDTDIIWDDNFPGSATGSIAGIKVKAKVLPTITMVLSASEINLGTLIADIESTWSLDIEIGTNAANGVVVTAKSGSGWLINQSNNTIVMNNSWSLDGVAESYTYSSSIGTHDSTITGFTPSSPLSATEVNNNTTEHIIYSTDKPEQFNWSNVDVEFIVGATANAQTPAWEYEDTVTFTITGSF